MGSYFETMGQEWSARSKELADWAFAHMVNRTDVWGSYIAQKRRRSDGGRGMIFFTAPFSKARGKEFLTPPMLVRHFCGMDGSLVSLHSTSADKTSKWLAVDIDRHEKESATVEGNFAAALRWHDRLAGLGFDPLLMDSNGDGGYHVLIVFSEPVPTANLFAFGQTLISDFEKVGLAKMPETYPKQVCLEEGHFGNCLRLMGRHHTRDHWTKVWSGEPETGEPWLDGAAAVDRILGTRLASPSLLPVTPGLVEELVRQRPKTVVSRRRPRVCVDLDGVLAAYDGWKGIDFTGAPLPGAVEFTRALSEFAEVVVFTTRCAVEPHRDELREPTRPASDLAPRLVHQVRYWLEKYKFTFDDVYVGQGKPIAHAYIDDRAVRCVPQHEGHAAYSLAAARARDLCRRDRFEPPPAESADPRLYALIRAWPELPEDVRARIAETAGGKGEQSPRNRSKARRRR
ncbi:MAG: hypothetical protein KIS92_18930 [Planctomycetota bacterium]|nr:hypothetical protein [Planctomycetota bacterium]